MKLAKGKMQGRRCMVHGGPWNMQIVLIPAGGTMVFSIPFNGHAHWHGFYDSVGNWHGKS